MAFLGPKRFIVCIAILYTMVILVPLQATQLDTAELFNALKETVRKNISLKNIANIHHEDFNNLDNIVSEQEVKTAVQAIHNNIKSLLTPYLHEIKIPRSTTDHTLVPYTVVNFKAVETITPAQLKMMADPFKPLHFPNRDKFLATIKFHADILKDTIGEISAQLVLFDAAARAELSKLCIGWFNFIKQDVPELLALFKDGQAIQRLMSEPHLFIDHIERIKTKARQYEHVAAPYLALWHIIVQDLLGEKTYTILFDQLPNSAALKSAYADALKALDVKNTIGALLEKLPIPVPPEIQQFLTADLVVWVTIGVLFMPESFQKAFVDEPIKQHEQDMKEHEEAQRTRRRQGLVE